MCPSCGVVTGESDFSNTPTCDDCGRELEKATMETAEKVERYIRSEAQRGESNAERRYSAKTVLAVSLVSGDDVFRQLSLVVGPHQVLLESVVFIENVIA